MRDRRYLLSIVLCLALAFLIATGCKKSGDDATGPGELAANTCVGCHTDQAALKALAKTENVSSEDSGEG